MSSLETDYTHDTPSLHADDDLCPEFLSLSPSPLPTGFSAYRSHNISLPPDNEVYLDLTSKVRLPERIMRRSLGLVLGLVTLFVAGTLALDIISLTGRRPAFERLHGLLSNDALLISMAALIVVVFIGSIIWGAWVWTRPYPVRFNRQRREIAYISAANQQPQFIAWEDVCAFVRWTDIEVSLPADPIRIYTLTIVLFAKGDVRPRLLLSSHSSLKKAVGEWESIRVFMEKGPKYLPTTTSTHEVMGGTLEHLNMTRRLFKEDSYLRYLLVFIPLNLLGGWTVPFHIAHRIKKLPRVGLPKEISQWSQSIASRSWKHPDLFFRKSSMQRIEYLQTGKTLMDYQRECLAGSPGRESSQKINS